MQLLKQLYDLGFTPLNCVLIMAILAIWKLSGHKDKKQTQVREEWHAETRQRVEQMQGHVERCDDDRKKLRDKQAKLEGRIDQMSRCPIPECPNRSTGGR